MRKEAAVLCTLVAAVLGLAPLGRADATPSCVTVRAIAPFLGDRSDRRCVPGPFTRPFFYDNCSVVPAANATVCVTLDLHTP